MPYHPPKKINNKIIRNKILFLTLVIFVLLRNLLQQYVGVSFGLLWQMKIVGVAQLAYLMVGKSNIYKLVLSRLGVWKALGQELLLQSTG